MAEIIMKKDIFISHASEDKNEIVEPLVQTLEKNGISCWYDKKDITWGDSIVEEVSKGLISSKYVVFIITRTFLAKKWTHIELNNTLNMQITSGEKKVLPIVVGDIQPYELPLLLQDKKYIEWNHQQEIVDELKKILGKSIDSQSISNDISSIPMPKRRKKITQLDKDRFVKELYQGIVKYFNEGLTQLKQHDNRIEIGMTKVTELKFIATVYLDGEIESQCKILMGGMFENNGITYSSGGFSINDDNSCNDWISIEEDEDGLFMKGSAMNFMLNQKEKLTNGKEAGEYFWKSFIAPLER